MARAAVLCATFCIHQAGTAQEALHFWTSSGEHGIDGCVFMSMPTAAPYDRIGRLVFGVSADPHNPELMGKVRVRQDGMPPGARLLEIGAGPQALLSVTLHTTNARTAMADVPAAAVVAILHSLATHAQVWMRIGDAAGPPAEQAVLPVAGKEEEVSSCVAILERDLAALRLRDPANPVGELYLPILFPW